MPLSKTRRSARRPSECSWQTWTSHVRSRSTSRRLLLSRAFWTGLLIVRSSVALAQIEPTSSPPPLFTWRDGVLAGGFVVATYLARPIDKRAALLLQDS